MKPSTPRSCDHFVNWCLAYQGSAIVAQPPHIRFSIGLYQIGQGTSWKLTSPVKWQSYCAAAMHFTMSAGGFGILLNNDLPEKLEDITETFVGWEYMLRLICKTQQQICYSDYISANSARRSRFDREALRHCFIPLISQCFALVPTDHREHCCYDEMFILTKDIIPKS